MCNIIITIIERFKEVRIAYLKYFCVQRFQKIIKNGKDEICPTEVALCERRGDGEFNNF